MTLDEINKTYGYDKDATWKRALLPADPHAPKGELPAFSCTHDLELRLDTGATCRFGAFPCIVYHNGQFYGIFAWQQKKQLSDHRSAVVMYESVPVKNIPSPNGNDEFTIHAGTKVNITDDTMADWKQIALPDGRVGWVSPSAIEKI